MSKFIRGFEKRTRPKEKNPKQDPPLNNQFSAKGGTLYSEDEEELWQKKPKDSTFTPNDEVK